MDYTCKNESLNKWARKRVTRRKMGYTRVMGSWVHLKKCGSHLEIWVTLAKKGHTCTNGSHLGRNESHLQKGVTLVKMGHTWKLRSHINENGSVTKK